MVSYGEAGGLHSEAKPADDVVIATEEASLHPDCVVAAPGIDERVDECVDDELGHRYGIDSELESLLSLIDRWLPRLCFGGGALKRG